jgi:type II secretory ATPase GspE/PulE/Tfp pilus assembly ATPase PilB-like protein
MTTEKADFKAIKVQSKKEGMKTLRDDAVRKLLEGQTSYQEVSGVTWESA